MLTRKKFLITGVFFSLIAFLLINGVTAINYSSRQDDLPKNVTQADARTTRQILESTTKIIKLKKKYTLQEGTEHLLQFGALLRTRILDIFGYLVYDRYDDFSISQMEALYRVYHETLERKYNIFDIVTSFFKDADIRPTKVCRSINENVHTCLKESSQLCMSIRNHNKRRLINLNHTPKIYELAKIQEHFPDGFSLKIILKHLQNGTLKFTPSLLSGLLHNIQYDSFDDEVRTAERELISYLTKSSEISKDSVLMSSEEIKNQTTVSGLLKTYLKNASFEFKNPVNFQAKILAEHVVREVEAISQNIELLGTVYENNTINLKYLLDLVLPPDVLDKDLSEAKEYLLGKVNELQVLSKYLRIEKYQQTGPDQLLMEILGQMRDIHFAVDIVSALHTHAKFWHRSRAIEDLNEFLELFSSYENLRKVKEYEEMMKTIDQIKNRLWNSKNVTIEIYCSNPRACLQIGLKIVLKCEFIDEGTKNLIKKFCDKVTVKGSPAEDECPLRENLPVKCDTETPEIKPEVEDSLDTTEEAKTEYPPNIEKILSTQENKTTTLFDNAEPSSEIPALLTSIAPEEISTTETSTKLGNIETTTTEKMITEAETVTETEISEEISSETSTVVPTTEEIGSISTTTENLRRPAAEVTTIDNTVENLKSTESSTAECSSSEECSSECSGQDCSTGTDCSTEDCTSENPCNGEDCKLESCTGENCTTTEKCNGNDCPSVECFGKDCSTTKETFTCSGEDCSNAAEEKSNCVGSDCPDADDKKVNCEGENCPHEKDDCEGKDCPDVKQKSDCKGENCPDKEGTVDSSNEKRKKDCVGKDCPNKEEKFKRRIIDCIGKDCPDKKGTIGCSGSDCPDDNGEVDCEGSDCPDKKGTDDEEKADCKGSDCSTTEKTDDCDETDCLDEEHTSSCSGSDCPDTEAKDNCTGSDCLDKRIKANCTGPDCPDKEARTDCTGSDCPTKEGKADCEGFECPEKEGEGDCEGFECPNKKKDDCKGSDCPNKGKNNCEGSNCPKEGTEAPCKGPECSEPDCKGKNCPPDSKNKCSGDDCPDDSKNKTIFCDNTDPHRRRKKERLLKMHQLEFVPLTTSKYEKLNSQNTTSREDYSSNDEIKATELNQANRVHTTPIIKPQTEKGPELETGSQKIGSQTEKEIHSRKHHNFSKEKTKMKEKVHNSEKKKHRIHHSNEEKGRKVVKQNHKEQVKERVKEKTKEKTEVKIVKKSNKHTHSKERYSRLPDQDENSENITPGYVDTGKEMTRLKENKNLKKKSLEEDLGVTEPNKDHLLETSSNDSNIGNRNHSSQRNRKKYSKIIHEDSEEGKKKMGKGKKKIKKHPSNKDLPKAPHENHQPTNPSRRSSINFPLDLDDIPLVYQTQKPTLKTVERSYFDDLFHKDDDTRPENRIFADNQDNIDKNKEILYPKRSEPTDDKDYYEEIDDSSDSRLKWLPWFQ